MKKTALKGQSDGFTLIEIAFAVLMLAGSLTVLLGLQSSSIQRAVHDRNMQQAMLVARQILTAVELRTDALDPGEETGPPARIIKKIIPSYVDDERKIDPTGQFTATLAIRNWKLPNFDVEVAKRITLTVSWSSSPLDVLTVEYFVPIESVPST